VLLCGDRLDAISYRVSGRANVKLSLQSVKAARFSKLLLSRFDIVLEQLKLGGGRMRAALLLSMEKCSVLLESALLGGVFTLLLVRITISFAACRSGIASTTSRSSVTRGVARALTSARVASLEALLLSVHTGIFA
jgi:hypothetical protein